jgi:flagellar basal-body rod modification protein FlgD
LSQVDGLIGRTLTTSDGSISGTVASVRIISGGAVAVLENGTQVQLGEGVEIS